MRFWRLTALNSFASVDALLVAYYYYATLRFNFDTVPSALRLFPLLRPLTQSTDISIPPVTRLSHPQTPATIAIISRRKCYPQSPFCNHCTSPFPSRSLYEYLSRNHAVSRDILDTCSSTSSVIASNSSAASFSAILIWSKA